MVQLNKGVAARTPYNESRKLGPVRNEDNRGRGSLGHHTGKGTACIDFRKGAGRLRGHPERQDQAVSRNGPAKLKNLKCLFGKARGHSKEKGGFI